MYVRCVLLCSYCGDRKKGGQAWLWSNQRRDAMLSCIPGSVLVSSFTQGEDVDPAWEALVQAVGGIYIWRSAGRVPEYTHHNEACLAGEGDCRIPRPARGRRGADSRSIREVAQRDAQKPAALRRTPNWRCAQATPP